MTFRKKLVMLGTIGIVGLSLAACSSGGGTTTSDTTSATPGSISSDDTSAAATLTFNPDNLLAGTASPSFLSGEAGSVSVVAQGTLETTDTGSILPIAFQNNTDSAIASIDWTATATSGGSEVATGQSEGTNPAQLQPGEVGLAFISFGADTATPGPDATYTFSANTSPADTSSLNTGSLTVTTADASGGSITGTAVNNTGASLTGPVAVTVYCFSADPEDLLQSAHMGYVDQTDDIAPDGNATFTVDLAGDTCATYLVGASGFFA
ncbi:MAG: hypothetical protein FWF43_04355 [Propionibacteriaceae bacterium]|nr:hypothetical protein [Propionibacteriaceae bacterium]